MICRATSSAKALFSTSGPIPQRFSSPSAAWICTPETTSKSNSSESIFPITRAAPRGAGSLFVFLLLLLRNDFACKPENARGRTLPRIGAQPRFAARFLQKLLFAQVVFLGYLRQQQSATVILLHQESMPSDFDFFGLNAFEPRQQRHFDFQLLQFLRAHFRKSLVLECGARCTPHDALA